MRETPTRAQVMEVVKAIGATAYSPGPMRAVRGVSFTFEQLEIFVNKMINPDALLIDRSEGSPASQWKDTPE